MKSVTIEHLETFHKKSKTERQAKKVSQVWADKNSNSTLYSETIKREKIWMKKMQK